jgi:hypothetical protein
VTREVDELRSALDGLRRGFLKKLAGLSDAAALPEDSRSAYLSTDLPLASPDLTLEPLLFSRLCRVT